MSDIIGMILIGIGVIFNFLGCLGLVRMPDVYCRLQASTKCVTLGTWSILLGVFIYFGISSIGIKALFCILLIALASPTASHALARGAHISGVKLCKKSTTDKYKEDTEKQD